jgi:prolipoprotein diacylglyceryltransferase
MYPTLSDALNEWFGISVPLPIQTFGLMMALSFFLAAYVLTLELKRKERQGLISPFTYQLTTGKPATFSEIFISAVVGFIIGFKLLEAILHYSDLVNDPQTFLLSSRGNILGGLLLGAYSGWSKYHEKEKLKSATPKVVTHTGHPHQFVMNITMAAAIGGLLGAKIFHNLENIDDFLKDPVDALISFSGLTFFGGLICGAAAVLWYSSKTLKIPPLVMCDATAPALMLSYGTGRLGCHLSGDGDWGIANTLPKPSWFPFPEWMWRYNYPHNVIGEGVPIEGCTGKHCFELIPPVFPTPLYEAIACILLFLLLWRLRKRFATPGMLFSVYILFTGIERLAIEQIRVNTKYHFGSYAITQAELISAALIVVSITAIAYLYRKSSHPITKS